jgi:hypothetical protein
MRRRSRLALILAAALAAPALAVETPGPAAVFLSSTVWQDPSRDFGGLSAIELAGDGTAFLAVTDRGTLIEGQIRRDGAGRITAIDIGRMEPLRGRGEAPLPVPRSDAEGLALTPDGTLYVSFEIAPRVLRYARPFGPAEFLPIPRDFNRMKPNGALESLALAPDGALYTLPEASFRPDGAHPVYRFRAGRWDQPFLLPAGGDFRPVGADFGPDGRFYLLERSFGLSGFATRLRRFDLPGDGPPGRPLTGGETLIETPAGTHSNLEGLSVWRDATGRLRLTMVSDNNFHRFLPTEIVEYALDG